MTDFEGHQTPTQVSDHTQIVQQYEATPAQRILIATISGVTAGLQALVSPCCWPVPSTSPCLMLDCQPPLHRVLREAGSDAEMRSFANLSDTDGYETDVTMHMVSNISKQ